MKVTWSKQRPLVGICENCGELTRRNSVIDNES